MERVSVIVERNQNIKIPTVVYDYEIPVLKAIHGDDNIHEQSRAACDEPFDAKTAYEGLMLKYRDKEEGMSILAGVFRDARDLARYVGEQKRPVQPALDSPID